MADPLDLAEATRRLIRTADGLTDEQYAEPSGLPGWSRGHVLAHLALNGEALAGALGGVVEGSRVPMYASDDARDADIDELSDAPPEVIRARLLGACTDLADALAAVPDDAGDTTIDRTPGGRTFTVGSVPGMRLGEVEIHHADLGAGYAHTDWPPEFSAHLLGVADRRVGVAFSAHATDLDRRWSYGAGGGPVVSGTAADLAWWVSGRGGGEGLTSDGGALPRMEAW